jgi:hypothetical protein
VLSDNQKCIYFVDVRNPKRRFFYYQYLNPLAFKYTKPCGEKAFVVDEEAILVDKSHYADVLSSEDNPHVASYYRVYIDHGLLATHCNLNQKCRTIYHEMTHKTLSTVDIDNTSRPVYGKGPCLNFTKMNHHQALKIADC